jgi:hypothetical protein
VLRKILKGASLEQLLKQFAECVALGIEDASGSSRQEAGLVGSCDLVDSGIGIHACSGHYKDNHLTILGQSWTTCHHCRNSNFFELFSGKRFGKTERWSGMKIVACLSEIVGASRWLDPSNPQKLPGATRRVAPTDLHTDVNT